VGYIQKPFEMDVLLAAVGAAVQDWYSNIIFDCLFLLRSYKFLGIY
jgi:DNA-binding response OmpR family regulator